MKLSDYAQHLGISDQTAWRHFQSGKIPYPTQKLPSGTVIVDYVQDSSIASEGQFRVIKSTCLPIKLKYQG
jgi:predicted site-specific integrase-resolvase